jgi:large subunit ribosomal protein L31
MKKNTHPEYKQVLYVDSTTGKKFLCGSAMKTNETDTFQGKTYPAYRASTSSASHPFFTGSNQLVDAEGRVDKFKKRYSAQAQKNAQEAAAKEEIKPVKKPAKKK